MKIAVVRLSAIGDCCLVLPVIKAILQQIPKAEIHWVIGKGAYSLIKNYQHPRLTYHAIDKPKTLKDYLNIKKHFKDTRFDFLFAMQASTRANLIYPMLKANTKIGFDFKRARELQWLFTNRKITFGKEHLHDSFCRFAHELNLDTNNLDWEFEFASEAKKATLNRFKLTSPYIVINPAASKLERSWFEENYALLIDWLTEKYSLPIVLTGSNAAFEIAMAKEIESLCKASVVNLVGKTDLNELSIILDGAELLIAPDTGPAHIANAMRTPVIGLYAVAPSWLSAPYHYQHLVIDKFADASRRILSKKPDSLPWNARVHDRKAMNLIKLEEVKSIIQKQLSVN